MTLKSPWILGLTGGIGSGKSAAARQFEALGVHTVDADHVARWVVEPGMPALEIIAGHFGKDVLDAEGRLNRAELRRRIFADEAQRRWLEALLHPLIKEEVRHRLAQGGSPYAIMVSPLLIESGQRQIAQRLLVIDVPEAVQMQRTVQRDNISEEQVRAILQAQINREDRLRHADDVLINDRDLSWLESEVARLHRFYLTLKGGFP